MGLLVLAAMASLAARADDHGPGMPHPMEVLPAGALAPSAAIGPAVPLTSVPLFSSRPAAPVKLYLNFTGATAQPWGSFNATATPAYDTDGDPTTFSTNELTQINEIAQRVAEKYSPFNIDVTTVDPKAYPFGQVTRVVIGGDGAWSGGVYGGYGYVHGFTGATSNTAWVFAKNLGQGLPKYVAEAAAHEAGHTFGLYHQSAYTPVGAKSDEYRGGRDKLNPNATDPIMGFSYYANRGVWSNGLSSESSTQPQDDLSIIGSNSFGFRPDDYGNDRFVATTLALLNGGTAISAAGVIEHETDADCFKFRSTGGLIDLAVDVAALGPMLDLKVSLADADGNVLFAADHTDSLGEHVTYLAPDGNYFLTVASHGAYGDVGQYTVNGAVVPEPAIASMIALAGIGALLRRRR